MKNTRIIFAALLSSITLGCSSSSDTSTLPVSTKYTCDDELVLNLVSIDGDETSEDKIVLYVPGKAAHSHEVTYRLTRVESASDEVFSDGIYSWWQKDDEANFTVDGVSLMSNCQSN